MSKNKYYKDPRYGNVYGYIVATPPGRLIWPQLAEPGEGYEYEGQQVEGKYEATILLDANSKETKEFMDDMKQQAEVMQDMYNEPTKSAGKKGKKKKVTLDIDFEQIFTHSEDADWIDIEQYPYYKDTIILKAGHKSQPLIRGASKKDTIDAADLEGGMLVQFAVNPLITSNGGVTFQLKIVKFVEDDGKRFGGGGFNVSKVADELFDDATSDDDIEETDDEEEAPFEEEADKVLGKGKKAKKKVVEEEEEEEDEEEESDDEEEEDTESEDDSESDDSSESDDDDAGDDSDEDAEDDESDDDAEDSGEEEEDEEEEEPAPKKAAAKNGIVKKAPPAAPAPKRNVTAEDIRARALQSKKNKEAAKKAGGKKAAIDRL